MSPKKTVIIIVFAALLTCWSGCAKTYTNKAFKAHEIDRIVVLPVLDNRQNPKPKHNFDEMARYANIYLMYNLKYLKKYRVAFSSDIGTVSSYTIQDLPSRDPKSSEPDSVDPDSVDSEWVKHLGPATEQWILVPVLEDLTDFNILVRLGGSATYSLYLFNKNTGELWWKSTDEAGTLPVGPIAVPILQERFQTKPVLEIMSTAMATGGCINPLPKRPKPYLLDN